MLLCLRLHDCPPGSEPEPESLVAPAGVIGGLGRLVGRQEDPSPPQLLELWLARRARSSAPPPGEGFELWHCLQDIAGIYTVSPRALASANALHLIERDVEEEQRNELLDVQRRLLSPRLAEQRGFLAGALAGSPPTPGRFLELGLWQHRDDARRHQEARADIESELPVLRGAPPRLHVVPILRRYTREADGAS